MLSITSSRYISSRVRLPVVPSCRMGHFGADGASVHLKCLVTAAEIDHQRTNHYYGFQLRISVAGIGEMLESRNDY